MATGRLKPERLVTARYPLSAGVAALSETAENREGQLKVLIDVNA
jgi:threonine dehydrogenase-like Zn-dependent dehydrogenase